MAQQGYSGSAFIIGTATDPGRVGKNNEDAWAVFQADLQQGAALQLVQVAVVADGIGGNNAGEIASKIAVEKVELIMRSMRDLPIPARMARALQLANQEIYNTGQNSSATAGMGSTMVMAAIVDDWLYVAHVGDSRAYLLRNGVVHRLTLDHTWAQEAIDIGRLSPEAARVHPNRNVIKRYLGVDETLTVDHCIIDINQVTQHHELAGGWPLVEQLRLLPGDTLLLCSDGLTDELTDPEVQAVMQKYEPQMAAEQLVAMANAHGGRDNITVVVLRVPGGAAPAATPVAAARTGQKSRLPLLLGLVTVGLLAAIAAFMALRPAPPVAQPGAAVAVTVAPTHTPLPTAESTAASTPAAATLVSAPTATANVAMAAGRATSTPIPTFTSTPTPTATSLPPTPTPLPPTPTLRPNVTATATGLPAASTLSAPTASPVSAGTVQGALLQPGDGETVVGDVRFSWRITEGELPAGMGYEVFFYRAGQDLLRDGFGLAQPTRGNELTVNLTTLDDNANYPLAPGDYLWGIRLSPVAGGNATRVVVAGRRLTYQRASSQPPPPVTLPTGTPEPPPTSTPVP
ncbi:MAG: PP2C family serine/threonine-protein phosphatase [Anaerolineae bacterium]